MSDTKEFPLFSVTIERGKDVLTVDVPEHEVLVLRAIHDVADGTERVKVVGPAGEADDPDTIALDADPRAELDRLNRKYNRINAPSPVRHVFPNGELDLRARGFDDLGAGPTLQKEGSQVIRHKQDKKGAAKK